MRKTKVIGFSIPPELHEKFISVLNGKHKTKSEFFREVLDTYFNTKLGGPTIGETNVAQVLKTYWDLRAKAHENIVVISLGIIVKDGKVLIGARKKHDLWVNNLSWVFPGGRMKSLDFSSELETVIKNETGLSVKAQSLVAARIHPDSGFKDVQIVALYFHCTPVPGKEGKKTTGDLSKLKWIVPSDVFRYFTTSVMDEVTKFLMTITIGYTPKGQSSRKVASK
jgi:8-oxo-dGTP pyrophosphatase MutT (NUDIX family)